MDDTTKIKELKESVKKFIEERDWVKYHNPKDLAESIVIEAAELLELFQWRRHDEAYVISTKQKGLVENEIADIMIYILSLSNILDIDISEAVLNKLEVNRSRFPIERFYGKID